MIEGSTEGQNMTQKKALLFINPSAGLGNAKNDLYTIVETLSVGGFEVTVIPVIPDHDLVPDRLLAESGDAYDLIACYGGDGTLSHTMNGYLKAGLTCPFGYFPNGSTNDFAKSVGISFHVKENAEHMCRDHIFRYDVGRFNELYFNYVAAFGAFTDISYNTPREAKRLMGHAAYVLNGLISLPANLQTRCHVRITHDGQTSEGEYLYGGISNATQIGGMKLPYKSVSLDDGVFEVALIRNPDNPLELQQIAASLAIGNIDSPYVEVFQTSELEVEAFGEVPWTIDGEYGGAPERVSVRICPKAIPLLV